ncbi:transmembrane protein 53-like [Salvia splendens]|uniref:transmembrane protein 53-like n=1 Tax=Salvia splendens TaxID=180675 RepID=UPI001C26ECF8|nr:transmembrane protein 53-like [Salvia splendens]
MAASAYILHSSYRRSTTSLPLYHLPRLSRQSVSSPHRFPSLSLLSLNHHSSKFPSFNPFPFSAPPNFSISATRLLLGHQNSSFRWNFAHGAIPTDHRNSIGASHTDSEVAVVILGWLGAKPKHLRRYVEMYNARGIHAVTFVASVMDVLSFDLGRKLEERVRSLADELAAWLSDHGGRDRILIFHTFSNTGWLAYGAILDNLKDRQDLLEKIKGCVVDSGGDPDIDPKVWAAGFTTALLKKSSSATYSSTETAQSNESHPFCVETLMLGAFEKLFSFLLNLPDVNRRLRKIISILSRSQPPCPQLYLYSTGDKVIPFQRVETFMDEQRQNGKLHVFSFDFGSSPHVDHYRTFPDVYASQLDNFLKECLSFVGKL